MITSIAPRPLYRRLSAKLRLAILSGKSTRCFPCLGVLPWYRQHRRGRWQQRPVPHIVPPSPRPCWMCSNTTRPKGLSTTHCVVCQDYMARYLPWLMVPLSDRMPALPQRIAKRPRIARPLFFPNEPMHRLRASRQRPYQILVPAERDQGKYAAWKHRPRTKFAYGLLKSQYLHKQRQLARQARARGFEQIRAGLWYDRVGDVAYLQSAVSLEPIEHVRFGGMR